MQDSHLSSHAKLGGACAILILLSSATWAATQSARPAVKSLVPTINEDTKFYDPTDLGDEQGNSVSLSGKRALIGAPAEGSSNPGAAYVFVRKNGQWVEDAKLTASDGATNNMFGYAVYLEGDLAIVGAPYYDGTAAKGEAYIYTRQGNLWTEQAILKASDGFNSDYFGAAVSLNHGRALVGALGHGEGQAYLFKPSGSTWIQKTIIKPPQGSDGDGFGVSVSLSGSRALIGTILGSHVGYYGASYIYALSHGTAAVEAAITPSNNYAEDDFGNSVSLEGDTALIGAPGVNDGFGAAYVYTFDGTYWNEQTELMASEMTSNDQYGYAVSLRGNHALLGAPGTNGYEGSASLFHYNGSTWSEQAHFFAFDGMEGDGFGSSVSLSDNRALIGAPFAYIDGTQYSGAAYVFGSH